MEKENKEFGNSRIKSLHTVDDYATALANKDILKDVCCGTETLKQGDQEMVCLTFRCEDFIFYLPSYEFPFENVEELDNSRINSIFLGMLGSCISFSVTAISMSRKIGMLSKTSDIYMLSSVKDFAKSAKENRIKEGDKIQLNVIFVSPKKLIIDGYGSTKTLSLKEFPDIRYQDFTKLYKNGDLIDVIVDSYKKPERNPKTPSELLIHPVNYDKLTNDELREESYYIGEIVSLSKKGVGVDCNGNYVTCKYPVSLLPYMHGKAAVKISAKKSNGFYVGIIVRCESPTNMM